MIRSKKAFLIDLRCISLEDLTIDDNGPYKHQGTRTKVCTVDVDEECHIREFKITDRKGNELHSHNSYYLIERNRVCEFCDALRRKHHILKVITMIMIMMIVVLFLSPDWQTPPAAFYMYLLPFSCRTLN